MPSNQPLKIRIQYRAKGFVGDVAKEEIIEQSWVKTIPP